MLKLKNLSERYKIILKSIELIDGELSCRRKYPGKRRSTGINIVAFISKLCWLIMRNIMDWIIIFIIVNFGFIELIEGNESDDIYTKRATGSRPVKNKNLNLTEKRVHKRNTVETSPNERLPSLDRPDFKYARENGQVYVDKTKYLQRMLKQRKLYNFLTRPRRFGKSYFISMLNEFFSGRKDLFKGLDIEEECPDAAFPIINLDFSISLSFDSMELFKKGIVRKLIPIAIANDIDIINEDSTMEFATCELIEQLFKKKESKVVVLIDEYDAPYVKTFGKPQNEDILGALRSFFSQLKGKHSCIHFSYISGITRIAVSDFFSSIERNDLTMESDYAAVLGFTSQELDHFTPWIKPIADSTANGNITAIKETMRKLFNGYRFSPSEDRVCNPCSVIRYLETKGEKKNYWSDESGKSDYYIKLLEESPIEYLRIVPLLSVNNTNSQFKLKISERRLNGFFKHYSSKHSFESLLSILYHSGYLSIFKNCTEMKEECPSYALHFPNEELRNEYIDRISGIIFQGKADDFNEGSKSQLMWFGRTTREALESQNWKTFIEELNKYYALIPWSLYRENTDKGRPKEKFYQIIFHCVMAAAGFDWITLEDQTSEGQADVVMASKTTIYIVETKLKENRGNPIAQCYEKYVVKYKKRGKEICCIGLVFSNETQIVQWGALVLSSEGSFLKDYGDIKLPPNMR